ncbi:unnamed protein product [Mytilus edulis]|uniref:Uncharacterized protein n=1 Tax=Mytilus edulis TaxID=6550 RepID=A0A8S3UWR4_MYTED|nr:unnamed protein product [Mytilus edulis]
MKLRHDNLEKNNRELENKYTAELTQNESMQNQIKNLTVSLSSMEKKNKNFTEELDMAKDIYKTEKKKSDDVERNITHALNETEKKQSDKIYQLQKTKLQQMPLQLKEETIDISQNEEISLIIELKCERLIAMVEYNNENVYLGVLQDSMLTFTRQPLGKLGPDFVIKDLNFSLNKKDRQLINSAYIIENIKCKIVKKQIYYKHDK